MSDIVDSAERVLSWPALQFTEQARAERARFRENFSKMSSSYETFCKTAYENQQGIIFAQVDKQVTGFFSNRTRNAARLMELYPDVDLFTPSLVDFNEGDANEYSSIMEQAFLYSAIAVATRGRFLPMISFHPERSYVPVSTSDEPYNSRIRDFSFRLQLKMIEFAILHLGFVGVKVHPSTGFAPMNNKKNGCSNNRQQSEDGSLPTEKAELFDEAMLGLYGLCRQCDVPIITHSGSGIPGPKNCMTEKDTNSPSQWSEALDRANKLEHDYAGRSIPKGNRLRVCLAHFAGGFKEKSLEPGNWLVEAAKVIKKEVNEGEKNLYLDLSAMSEWFSSDKKRIRPEYKAALREFLGCHKHVAQRLMYGSDWHMPSVARVGKRYLPAMQDLLADVLGRDSDNFHNTMGGNTAEFLKLRKGEIPRQRIDKFLTEHGIGVDEEKPVGWREKVDREFETPRPLPQDGPTPISKLRGGKGEPEAYG